MRQGLGSEWHGGIWVNRGGALADLGEELCSLEHVSHHFGYLFPQLGAWPMTELPLCCEDGVADT